jgi:hypothetical protein
LRVFQHWLAIHIENNPLNTATGSNCRLNTSNYARVRGKFFVIPLRRYENDGGRLFRRNNIKTSLFGKNDKVIGNSVEASGSENPTRRGSDFVISQGI